MIWEKLNPAMILTNLEVHSSDKVMEKVGGAVIQAGYAKESYVQALKDREKDYPTGLDVDGIGVHCKKRAAALAAEE